MIFTRVMGTALGAAIRTNSPWPMPGRRSLQTVWGSPSASSRPREPGTLDPRATSNCASGGSNVVPASLAVTFSALLCWSADNRCTVAGRSSRGPG